MNRVTRLVAGLAILLCAPGLAPYQAAAQVMAGRAAVSAPASASSAAGSIGSVVPNISLPSANLAAPSLSPALTNAPAPVFKPVGVLGTFATPAPANDAARALPLPANVVAFAAKPAAAPSAVRPAAAVLTESAARVEAAAKPGAATTPEAELGALFEAASSRRALDSSVLAAASESGRDGLEPASAREPSKGPRWVEKFSGDPAPAAPRHSVKRTLSVGFLAAVIPIVITGVTVAIAAALGHQLHPNYQGPGGSDAMTVLQALAIWVGAAIMAPVSEEAIFRGGIQGRLAKLSAKLRLGDFVVPALITSTIFVALHETSDPVLFGTRMVHALILSYVYKKEGILAAMAAHGFFNGLLALSLVFTAIGMPLLSLAVLPAALWGAWRARKFLKSQKPDVASGAVKPMPMSGLMSLVLAATLLLGYTMLMPNIFWIVGAVILGIHGLRKIRQSN